MQNLGHPEISIFKMARYSGRLCQVWTNDTFNTDTREILWRKQIL